MKRNFLMMAFVCLFTVVALSSCTKDDDENKVKRKAKSGAINNILTVAVENNNYNSLIDMVQLGVYNDADDIALASADYANGGFTINLPESLNSQYLESLGDTPSGITVSDSKVKTGYAYLEACISNSTVGLFYSGTGEWEGELIYVDGDLSITGTHTDTEEYYGVTYTVTERYNMNLKKGWNIIYSKETESENTYSVEVISAVPPGAKWYYGPYYNGDGSSVSGSRVRTPFFSGKQKSANSGVIGNTLTVAVENGGRYNSLIDAVKLEIDDVALTSADYTNGGFTITLPESLNNWYLESFGYIPSGITVSDSRVKVGYAYLEAYKSNSNVGLFYRGTEEWEGELMYVDGDLSITGAYTDTEEYSGVTYMATEKYNMHLKKGWNIIYGKVTESGNSYTVDITTTVPSGAKWYFYSYGDDNASSVSGSRARTPLLSGKQKSGF
ncbi:MAG: hypothetical protein LBQ01_02105 [Prevotellaceae bacterium]|nr:hypothetical protein [Prevotellaceae bacterium]